MCPPPVRADVVYVATPLLSVPVPKVAAPSLKVTVPVAADGDMVAVNVTLAPNVGLAEEVVRAVVEDAGPTDTETPELVLLE